MPAPEPVPASWVQVGPGKYVRGEESDPAPDAPLEAMMEDATEAPTIGDEPTHPDLTEATSGEPVAGHACDDPRASTRTEAQEGVVTDLVMDRSGR